LSSDEGSVAWNTTCQLCLVAAAEESAGIQLLLLLFAL